jgi:UDP-glucose 4-epimerase
MEPGMSAFAAFGKAVGIGEFSLDQLDLFVHGRVVDVTKLIKEYGYTPRPTAEAFADMIMGRQLQEASRLRFLGPEQVAVAESAVLNGVRAARAAISGKESDG